MRKRYRSHVGVLLDILRAIDSEGQSTISSIIQRANIPYERLKLYIQKLLEEGYIDEVKDSDKTYYKITIKGYRLMDELSSIKRIFDKLGFLL